MERFTKEANLYGITRSETTTSAKSLGTPPVNCAINELQNPLPFKTMLFEGHKTSTIGISDAFLNS